MPFSTHPIGTASDDRQLGVLTRDRLTRICQEYTPESARAVVVCNEERTEVGGHLNNLNSIPETSIVRSIVRSVPPRQPVEVATYLRWLALRGR